MRMIPPRMLGFVAALAFASVAVGQVVSLETQPEQGRVRVMVGESHFADYIHEGLPAPAVYPIHGPGGVSMVRHFPFVKGVKGEATDHPHHRSLWYAHGSVNGVDFWHGAGRIVTRGEVKVEGDTITAEHDWNDGEGKTLCTDTTRLRFGVEDGARFIDFTITFQASQGDVTFGDTKEGTMAIRTHPNLRLVNDPRQGVTTANGKAASSEGVEGKAVWGKRAAWVDYWGKIEGRTVGIAIFDHPENPRFPTWWHAREYGLVAANPFGAHDFEGKPRGTGDFKIKSGETATFRYRFLFHEGDVQQARIAERFEAWSRE